MEYLFQYLTATLNFYTEIVAADQGHYNAAYVYEISKISSHKYSTATDKLNEIIEASSLAIASFYKNETKNAENFNFELSSELN